MNIETLKMFKDLIDTQSFTKAAQLNFVTQSAVSQHMKKLEIIFKTKLFIKKNDSLELTRIGKIVYDYSSDIISRYYEMFENVNLSFNETLTGEVRISSIYSVGIYILGDYIREFMSLNPSVKISLSYFEWSEVIERVIEGKSDIGFIACKRVNDHNISSIHLCNDELVVVMPQNADGHNGKVPVSCISSMKLVFFEKNTPSRKYIENFLKRNSVKINVTMELNNIDTIKAAIISGVGCSILPYRAVMNEERNGKVKVSRFSSGFFRPVYMIYNKRKEYSRDVNKFINFILLKKKQNYEQNKH
ncbi:MAG: LysR substrate-binding domain-containing protein [Elusimicrobiales bacterium]